MVPTRVSSPTKYSDHGQVRGCGNCSAAPQASSRAGGVEGLAQRGDGAGGQQVVAVAEEDERGGGGVEPGVAGRPGARAALGLAQESHGAVLPGGGQGHLGRAVGAAVVDEDDLDVVEVLVEDRAHAVGDVGLDVEHRDDDRDTGPCGDRHRRSNELGIGK